MLCGLKPTRSSINALKAESQKYLEMKVFLENNPFFDLERNRLHPDFMDFLHFLFQNDIYEKLYFILINEDRTLDEIVYVNFGSSNNVISPTELITEELKGRVSPYVVTVHNHPSGSTKPSDADRGLAKYVARVIHEQGKTLVENYIVTRDGITVFDEKSYG